MTATSRAPTPSRPAGRVIGLTVWNDSAHQNPAASLWRDDHGDTTPTAGNQARFGRLGNGTAGAIEKGMANENLALYDSDTKSQLTAADLGLTLAEYDSAIVTSMNDPGEGHIRVFGWRCGERGRRVYAE